MKQIYNGIPVITVLIISTVWCITDNQSDSPHPPCSSNIYCHGPLLHTVQMAKIFVDSKSFVDMYMSYSPNTTLALFENFMEKNNKKPNVSAVRGFVDAAFVHPFPEEFETWEPADSVERPKFVDKIKDEDLRDWALQLNSIWKTLGRKPKYAVRKNPERYSEIWVPNPVIVPGGRFREFHYWDSYWIVRGLLLSEMYRTVKGMLENFMFLVDKYGHVPKGGRVYYLDRSGPPLLIPMVKSYVDSTKDMDFIGEHISHMEKEFEYWMKKHAKQIDFNGKKYTLASYGVKSRGPRPEGYSEDVEAARIFRREEEKDQYYTEIKTASESGWEFSSRWFIKNGTNKGNLTDTKTRGIFPVDLNSLIYWNAVLLSEFNNFLNNSEKVRYYDRKASEWMEAVTAVLWHEDVGVWLDYDTENSVRRNYFYPTNISPLWTGCYNRTNKDRIVKSVLRYLQQTNAVFSPGGVPASTVHTGEQWDYPNAWPPLQHMMIMGLENTGDEAAKKLAFELAEKLVRSVYKTFNESGVMLDKYDATVPGGPGGGGEYEVQTGYGSTNGVIMDLLQKYSEKLRADVDPSSIPTTRTSITPASSTESVGDKNREGSTDGQNVTSPVFSSNRPLDSQELK